MWGKTRTVKSSRFFEGYHIVDILKNSVFGKIQDIFKTLFEVADQRDYTLPNVIVIGNESTGKSSLLENVIKCQIFPRDSTLCTKCPIRLRIRSGNPLYQLRYKNPDLGLEINKEFANKTEIYDSVKEIMKKIPTDEISEHEIIIEMTDHELPTFEFFDLPGIRTYPPKMAAMTMDLCKKYLENKNSIILCVIPATTTRLTSCQSIALINEMGMAHNCILALTMVDRLQPINVEELLIKRILKTSDEMEGLSFAGCIGIVNRIHTDYFSLEENDKNEIEWFDENIICDIPEEYRSNKSKIEANVTIEKLLLRMDELYNKYIQKDWKPRILEKITGKLSNLKQQLDAMGEPMIPGNDFGTMFNDFIDLKLKIQFLRNKSHIINSSNITDEVNYDVFTQASDLLQKLTTNYHKNPRHQQDIINFVNSNFFIEAYSTKKINRFADAREFISENIKKYYEDEYHSRLDVVRAETFRYMVTLFGDSTNFTVNDIKEKFEDFFCLFVTNSLFLTLRNIDYSKIIFTEEASYIKQRERLVNDITTSTNYYNTVNTI